MDTFYYLFPYESVPQGSVIVIYGAGKVGEEYVKQIQEDNYCRILYVADKNFEKTERLYGVDVCNPQRLVHTNEYDYVVVSSVLHVDTILHDLGLLLVPVVKIVSAFPAFARPYVACAEDIVVRMIFKFLGYETFSYIDIGANDPYEGSNTAQMYLAGCRGVCVEPNPVLVKELETARPEDTVLNCVVAAKAGVLSYYMFKNNVYNKFVESNAKLHDEWADSSVEEIREIPVITPLSST